MKDVKELSETKTTKKSIKGETNTLHHSYIIHKEREDI